jgi:hypothetical protein
MLQPARFLQPLPYYLRNGRFGVKENETENNWTNGNLVYNRTRFADRTCVSYNEMPGSGAKVRSKTAMQIV